MVDPATVVAVALIVVAVVASVVPLVPAGLTALAGVLVYVLFGPGVTGPLGWLVVLGLVLVGALTAAVEHLGGPMASKAGGAETSTVLLAGVASFVLFFLVGPLGIILGLVTVVAGAELYAGKPPREAAVAAAWTVVGVLGSAVAQFLLTLSMLVAFAAYVLVLA